MTQDEAYKEWWHNEGSGIIPLPNEDMEEFAHRITQIAWSNGAFKEREKILFAIKEVRGRSQEPVAWMVWGEDNVPSLTFKKPSDKYVFDSLYITPPHRPWVGLTDEEAIQMHIDCNSVSELFDAIDAKLKYKNTKGQE